jgi:accessory secretory protein Asp1
MHRQNTLTVPYFSIFDELQGFEHGYVRPMNYLNLDWPSDVSFYYNPYIVNVMKDGQIHARVYPTEDGTLHSVKFYENEIAVTEQVYDDRGILSSIINYDEKGELDTQRYLNAQGDWIITEHIKTGAVQVNPQHADLFAQTHYDSLDAMIQERLQAYLQRHDQQADTVVLALNKQHNQLVLDSLDDQTLILSKYTERTNDSSPQLIARAKGVFSNDISRVVAAPNSAFGDLPILYIFPLDNQIAFGESDYEADQNITLFVDNLSADQLDDLVSNIVPSLKTIDNARLQLCTLHFASLDFLAQLKALAQKYNAQFASTPTATVDEGYSIQSLEIGEAKIQVIIFNRQAEILQAMAKSRVYIDMGDQLNYNLKMEAISAGVPQIGKSENLFLVHQKNGYVVADSSEVGDALNYFLLGLRHWDESLIFYNQLKLDYTDKQVLSKWKVMKEGIDHANSANRAN